MSLTALIPRESDAVARLRGRVVQRRLLGPRTRDAMFALLRAHFAGVDRATFDRDLEEKRFAILLEDGLGTLRGFSTMMTYERVVGGRTICVVYSGDTIVERAWWGSPALARTWIAAALQASRAAGTQETYWLLLTSGFRTYRFLPVFFREFYPRFDAETPAETSALIRTLAHERFGRHYDAAAGIVQFARPQVLTPDLLALPEGRLPDPHVAFFVDRNPGFVQGDELVCLTKIDAANLTHAGLRMAREALDARERGIPEADAR